MVFEIAQIVIDSANAKAFETAVAGCAPVFRQASGCRSMALERQIEDPTRYVLRVAWDSVEDHMVGFRNSSGFQQWRNAVGSFFAEPVTVSHYEVSEFF